MSLLKRLEHGGAPTAAPPTAPSAAATSQPAPTLPPEPTPARTEGTGFRPAPVPSQANEAQRSLKERVKRKLIAELDPSLDTAMVDEVRLRLKNLFDQIIEAENLVLTR